MAQVDVRIRIDEERPALDPDAFFAVDLPAAIDANAWCVLPALEFVAPRPMVVEVAGSAWTLECTDGRVRIAPGARDGARVHIRLTPEQLDDLVNDQQTFMSLW